MGKRNRPGPIGCKHALKVMPGGGADKFARVGCKQLSDCLGVGLFDRLSSEDHRTGVDIRCSQTGYPVRVVDEYAQPVGVNCVIRTKRRQQDRGTPKYFPLNDDKLAGQHFRLALQVNLGKHEMRGRAADVDPHSREFDVIDLPDELD